MRTVELVKQAKPTLGHCQAVAEATRIRPENARAYRALCPQGQAELPPTAARAHELAQAFAAHLDALQAGGKVTRAAAILTAKGQFPKAWTAWTANSTAHGKLAPSPLAITAATERFFSLVTRLQREHQIGRGPAMARAQAANPTDWRIYIEHQRRVAAGHH